MNHARPPRSAVSTAMMLVLTIAWAGSPIAAEEMLHWQGAWVRSLPPGAEVTAAYGTLMNHGAEVVSIANINSTLGNEAQMHDVLSEGDQRRMVQLPSIDIAPGESLVFQPGGRHIMLIGVTETPAEGSDIELCAESAAGTRACTQAKVRRQAPEHHDAHSGHHH